MNFKIVKANRAVRIARDDKRRIDMKDINATVVEPTTSTRSNANAKPNDFDGALVGWRGVGVSQRRSVPKNHIAIFRRADGHRAREVGGDGEVSDALLQLPKRGQCAKGSHGTLSTRGGSRI